MIIIKLYTIFYTKIFIFIINFFFYKIVHKNVSRGCNKIRKSESNKIPQPSHSKMRPYVTFKDILYFKKNLCLNNDSNSRNFYYNWLINKCERKNLAYLSYLALR